MTSQNRLTISLVLPRTPRCPICTAQLFPDAFVFSNAIAYCHSCAGDDSPGIVEARLRVINVVRMHRIPSFWTFTKGLHIYTPPAHRGRPISAHLVPAEAESPSLDDCT